MNKTELIDAIQQVIVPNGQKGITAESLANLLIEMVNATPEGGSGGGSGVVFTLGRPNEDLSDFVLTDADKAHNAAMFAAVAGADIMPCICVDASGFFYGMLAQDGISAEGLKAVVPSATAMYIPKELALIEGEKDVIDIITQVGEFAVFEDGTCTPITS